MEYPELFQKLTILGLPVLGCYGQNRVEFSDQVITPEQARLYRAVLRTHTFKGPLNKEQYDVLRLVAEGRTNKEMSVLLQTSIEMIEYHVRALRGRLRAFDRANAVAIAFRAGILK